DLYMQLQILFKNDYNWFFKWDYNHLKSMENLDSFNEKINPFFCRTTKKDLLVPKANEDIIKNILMSNDEENLFKLIYREFKNSNPLEFIIRCMQASSNPKLLKTKISIENLNGFKNEEEEVGKEQKNNDMTNKTVSVNLEYSSKFIECVNFIKKLVQKEKKIILWCIFIETMNDFLEFLNKENISCRIINGSVDLVARENIIDDFQNKKFSVLIANPNTIAESVSLHQNCHDAIYYEYSYNLTHLIQSKDRIHRLGLKDDVQTNYYFFCLTNNNDFNSIDSIIYNRLREKEREMLEVIENKKITSTITSSDDWKDIIEKMIYK
ncbi:MAG: SWF/SNF helicase family protein, partial [Mycoplasmataceae bacterium]|nr:SWF/SNF helicase family protein [Mycoplasmataceae bacterium]